MCGMLIVSLGFFDLVAIKYIRFLQMRLYIYILFNFKVIQLSDLCNFLLFFQMSTKSLIVWYNGKRVNEIYIGGEKRFVLVHVVGLTFEWFFVQIQNIVAANRDRYNYLLSSLVDTPEFKNLRLDIKNDIDLNYVMKNLLVPNIYVTLNPKLLSSSMLQIHSQIC